MKIVVDTNVLMTFFWPSSAFRQILDLRVFDCVAPEYALEEINVHSETIRRKTKLSLNEFTELREELAVYVEFVPLEVYQSRLKRSLKGLADPNDVDFIALALHLKVPLWSNDKRLKEQQHVDVFSTKDLLEAHGFFAEE